MWLRSHDYHVTLGLVDASPSNKQLLDQLPVERERGITVKAQTASMQYRRGGVAHQPHLLNLIDTPVHRITNILILSN